MGKKLKMDRGLSDLFSDNEIDETEETSSSGDGIKMVRISMLEPNKDQPRENFDPEAMQELTESVRQKGILQPILVRPLENGDYQIVAGERRWRAARGAGLTEVPVYVRELSDKDTMQIALIENIQRQDLSVLEEAYAYQNLMDSYNMTQQEVAEAVGKSRSAVANTLRLLTLNMTVKKYLEVGELSAGHARALVTMPQEKQLAYAEKIRAYNWSVRDLENHIQSDAFKPTEEDKEKARLMKELQRKGKTHFSSHCH